MKTKLFKEACFSSTESLMEDKIQKYKQNAIYELNIFIKYKYGLFFFWRV